MPTPRGLRAIALLEAAKGALVIVAGFGLLLLVHHDAQAFAEQLVSHLHLNPAHDYPHVFVAAVARLTDARLQLLSAGAMAYAAVRFAEAYGLWRGRRWAEWLGAGSGAIYVPFEIYEVATRPAWLGIAALVVNTVVVTYLLGALRGREAA